MSQHPFETVDVFTSQRFGGNPLAVFPGAVGISDTDMQRLAAELNLSETTFVLPPRDAANTARVRIFNRSHEMPFAGHPMVGTAFVLARWIRDAPDAFRFEVPAGIVKVRLKRDGAGVHGADIDAPQSLTLGLQIPGFDIAASAGIGEADVVLSNHPPTLASVGNTYVIAEVTSEGLSRAVPDMAAFRRTRDAFPGLNGRFSLYLYARNEDRINARMFAPLAGTYEDPATGSAATPLAALLLSLSGGDRASFDIHQGVQMGRPSLLHTTAYRAADGIRATVGGFCVSVLRGEATL
ncbi:MAG: PhzF family phenazine biosynthesis protein [Vicinamibacteria bacterium]